MRRRLYAIFLITAVLAGCSTARRTGDTQASARLAEEAAAMWPAAATAAAAEKLQPHAVQIASQSILRGWGGFEASRAGDETSRSLMCFAKVNTLQL
ncbi:MAG: hypothetical protein R2758_11055 [Bacteroidales bacterium]